jgi:hypothetical protein
MRKKQFHSTALYLLWLEADRPSGNGPTGQMRNLPRRWQEGPPPVFIWHVVVGDANGLDDTGLTGGVVATLFVWVVVWCFNCISVEPVIASSSITKLFIDTTGDIVTKHPY